MTHIIQPAGSVTLNRTSNVPQGSFLSGLESVRGIAALAVALFHSFHLIPVDGTRAFDLRLWDISDATQAMMRLLFIPFNGGAAVILFFVLSGFVLYLSLKSVFCLSIASAAKFSARRFLRIYPALAVNILAFAIVWILFDRQFPQFGMKPYDTVLLVQNLALRDYSVNGVTWTLLIELLAVPGILIAKLVDLKWPKYGLAICALSFFIIAVTPLNFKFEFVKFYYLFALGMLVAKAYLAGAKLSAHGHAWILSSSLAFLLCARIILGHYSKWTVLVEGVSSAGLIAAIVLLPTARINRALEARPLRFLGRVSFSFYLYHPLALGVIYNILSVIMYPWMIAHPILGSSLIGLTTVPIALPLAWIAFRLIERPSITVRRLF